MKKITFLFLTIVISVSLAGCSESQKSLASVGNTPSEDAMASSFATPSDSPTTEVEEEMNTKEVINDVNKDKNSFIPSGWQLFENVEGESMQAEGDLNKDGIADIALVIEQSGSTEGEGAPPRALIIAFGSKDHTYTLSINSEKALLRADEGGIWGDPLESITIDKGSVVITEYGGSNWRWYNVYRFRFQENDWYLIGAKKGQYFSGTHTRENADEEDYNLLTGDYVIRKTDEDGHTTITKGNRGKKKLITLKDFNRDDI